METTIAILALSLALGLGLWAWRLRNELAEAHTELKRCCTEQEKQSESQLVQQHALLDSMMEGVLVIDGEGQVEMTNASLRRLFGLTDDALGRPLDEVFELDQLTELASAARDSGELRDAEFSLTKPDPRQLHVNALCPKRSGEAPRTILVFHDVTRLKELENTRRDFVANVSHELRTPLSLIKGFTETLLDGAVADEVKARQFLHTIDKHADRLGYLIDDLLTLSRLESDQLAMNRQPTELQPLADRVHEDLLAKAAKRSISLKTNIPDGLMLDADGDRLQQAVFNLVDNAIKYGRTEGSVIIEAHPNGDGMAEVSVADDGPGIPTESVEKVFERFFRVDKARSRESGGTGLGLAIVKHIIQAHGGSVRLESREKQGSRFIFSMPLATDGV